MENDRSRAWALILVALACLLIGMALGQIQSSRGPGRSRIDWPPAKEPQPRSLGP